MKYIVFQENTYVNVFFVRATYCYVKTRRRYVARPVMSKFFWKPRKKIP